MHDQNLRNEGEYIFITKPLHVPSGLIILFCTIGIISSILTHIYDGDSGFSIGEVLLIDSLLIFMIITTHHFTQNIMRYRLYPNFLQVPKRWIKPATNNTIIQFIDIASIIKKKSTYSLINIHGVEYIINPVFNKELIPELEGIMGEQWSKLLEY